MKYLSLLLLPLSLYAQTCVPMDYNRKVELQDRLYQTTHKIILIQSGIDCVNGLFVNGTASSSYSFCLSQIENTRTIIMNTNNDKFSLKTTIEYDELNMPINSKTDEFNRLSCQELYKNFKKKIK